MVQNICLGGMDGQKRNLIRIKLKLHVHIIYMNDGILRLDF